MKKREIILKQVLQWKKNMINIHQIELKSVKVKNIKRITINSVRQPY